MGILGARPMTRRSYAANTHDTDGYTVQGASTDTTIKGSLQPASGDDLQVLSEGDRVRRARKVYTTTLLYAGGVDTQRRSDDVIDGADTWQVMHVERQTALIPHYKAILLAPAESVE